METLRKSTAVFCAISFIFTGVVSLFLFNFDRNAFTAETYQRAFAQEDFYNKLPAVMAEVITSSTTDQSQFPIVMRGMSRQSWEAFFRALLPPDVLTMMGDDVLNSVFSYINRQTDSVWLDLAPLKTNLTSDSGVQAVFSLLQTLPACDLFQIGQMTINLLSGGEIELCNPPAELYPMLTPVIQSQLQFTAAVMPDQVMLISAPTQNDPRQRLQSIRLFMRFSPVLPLVLLLTLTVFAVRSWQGWLKWWGFPFFVTGLGAFVLAFLGGPVFGEALQRVLALQMPDYLPAILLDYTGDLASAMVGTLLSPVMLQGLAFVAIGMGMMVAGYLLKVKGNKKY